MSPKELDLEEESFLGRRRSPLPSWAQFGTPRQLVSSGDRPQFNHFAFSQHVIYTRKKLGEQLKQKQKIQACLYRDNTSSA